MALCIKRKIFYLLYVITVIKIGLLCYFSIGVSSQSPGINGTNLKTNGKVTVKTQSSVSNSKYPQQSYNDDDDDKLLPQERYATDSYQLSQYDKNKIKKQTILPFLKGTVDWFKHPINYLADFRENSKAAHYIREQLRNHIKMLKTKGRQADGPSIQALTNDIKNLSDVRLINKYLSFVEDLTKSTSKDNYDNEDDDEGYESYDDTDEKNIQTKKTHKKKRKQKNADNDEEVDDEEKLNEQKEKEKKAYEKGRQAALREEEEKQEKAKQEERMLQKEKAKKEAIEKQIQLDKEKELDIIKENTAKEALRKFTLLYRIIPGGVIAASFIVLYLFHKLEFFYFYRLFPFTSMTLAAAALVTSYIARTETKIDPEDPSKGEVTFENISKARNIAILIFLLGGYALYSELAFRLYFPRANYEAPALVGNYEGTDASLIETFFNPFPASFAGLHKLFKILSLSK